ncbi:DUF4328 domain-containing protein [Actinocorallia populi]|uniref:DUF4328 domain-containing protein n=1 Tax=Actinocorallia populi TaxID=2079200 RepID=UPI00130098C3|nr:DUF4328 domain-containing protein [Actinocorallia populi]
MTAVPAGIEVFSAVAWLVISRGLHGDLLNLSAVQLQTFADLDRVAAIGVAVTWPLCAAVFIVWLFLARADVDAFGRHAQSWGRPWLFFGWVIPLANLVIPHRIVADLWIGGNPADDDDPEHTSTSLVDYWWMFLLLSWFVGRIAGNLDTQSVWDFNVRACAAVADGAVTITAAALAARIVLGVNRGLREQAATAGSVPVPTPHA